MTVVALLLLAGAAGASLRYLLSLAHSQYGAAPAEWPVGTLAANLIASFALGLYTGEADAPWTDGAFVALTVGGFGALSTWSTVALEAMLRFGAGHRLRAATYVASSIVSGIGAAWLGLQL